MGYNPQSKAGELVFSLILNETLDINIRNNIDSKLVKLIEYISEYGNIKIGDIISENKDDLDHIESECMTDILLNFKSIGLDHKLSIYEKYPIVNIFPVLGIKYTDPKKDRLSFLKVHMEIERNNKKSKNFAYIPIGSIIEYISIKIKGATQ